MSTATYTQFEKSREMRSGFPWRVLHNFAKYTDFATLEEAIHFVLYGDIIHDEWNVDSVYNQETGEYYLDRPTLRLMRNTVQSVERARQERLKTKFREYEIEPGYTPLGVKYALSGIAERALKNTNPKEDDRG